MKILLMFTKLNKWKDFASIYKFAPKFKKILTSKNLLFKI